MRISQHQMEMVTGKTLRNRSMYQRTIEHTVHLMLYGVIPSLSFIPLKAFILAIEIH